MAEFADTIIVEIMRDRIAAIGKSHRELAFQVGIKPNHFSMIVNGIDAMPFERFPQFVTALGLDGKERAFLMAAMVSYRHSKVWKSFNKGFVELARREKTCHA